MLSAPSHRKDELAEEVPALLCGRAALSTSKAPAEAYPAQSKTFLRQGPAHGFPQNLKSQFVGRSLASVLLKKKKKKKRACHGKSQSRTSSVGVAFTLGSVKLLSWEHREAAHR